MRDQRVVDGLRGPRFSHYVTEDESNLTSLKTYIAFGFATIYIIHLLIKHLALPFHSPADLVWKAILLFVPELAVKALYRVLRPGMMPASKEEALRDMVGLPRAGTKTSEDCQKRRMSLLPSFTKKVSHQTPPGLGNWDNSCYQNSILQGLASLSSVRTFLDDFAADADKSTMASSLHGLVASLTDKSNNGSRLWIPAKLKSMSSWQQQDAQEYYSRVLDDVEKDLEKQLARLSLNSGLSSSDKAGDGETMMARHTPRSPLDGLLAQRVACVKCQYSEGLTLLPFNCLTLSLGNANGYSLEDRLNDYTKLESIEDVECLSCTFRNQQRKLEGMLVTAKPAKSSDPQQSSANAFSALDLPSELRQQVMQRLKHVERVIEDLDFTDEAVKKCGIKKDQRLSSTKTKQVVIARTPQNLVVHINRSIFDEMTGALRKNMAFVSYPHRLNLQPWVLGQYTPGEAEPLESWPIAPGASMNRRQSTSDGSPAYVLRAIVTHSGRHENGHYICYRQHQPTKDDENHDEKDQARTSRWWRLSDDDVSEVTEDSVLNQGGVFMLFYERIDQEPVQQRGTSEGTVASESSEVSEPVELPIEASDKTLQEMPIMPEAVGPSKVAENDHQDSMDEPSIPSDDASQHTAATASPKMRTARAKRKSKKHSLSAVLPAVAAQ